MPRILADLYAKRAAGGQALRTLLGKGEPARDEALPVRPFEALVSEAPAVTEPITPKPAPPPAQAPSARRSEPVELLVTEYMLEPDPKEQTLEDVLRTEASHRHETPVPLGQSASISPMDGAPPDSSAAGSNDSPAAPFEVAAAPSAPLPTPAPAPVPRFVELSLEDAGGEETMEIPAELPRTAEARPGEDRATSTSSWTRSRRRRPRPTRSRSIPAR